MTDLETWITANLEKCKRINDRIFSSYGIKATAERAIDRYISNQEMIDAMHASGFRSAAVFNPDSPNRHFNVTSRSWHKAWEMWK